MGRLDAVEREHVIPWEYSCPECDEEIPAGATVVGTVDQQGSATVLSKLSDEQAQQLTNAVMDHVLANRATHTVTKDFLVAAVRRQIDEQLEFQAQIARRLVSVLGPVFR